MKVQRQAKDLTAFYAIQLESDEPVEVKVKPEFRGASTSREMAKIIAKYVPVTINDIHDILNDALSDELHYYLCKQLDVSNVNMDNVVYLAAYEDLVNDLSFYLNIE